MLKTVTLLAVIGIALGDYPCGVPVVQQDLSCGEKIVGGCKAKPYSWPWQAAFAEKSGWSGSYSLICGASLIANQWVMTAGHCVEGSQDDPTKFRVKLGVFDRANNDEPGEVVAEIESIHLHPDYNPSTVEWDISLLKLKQPVAFSDHIIPVCLPKSDDIVINSNHSAWCTGWGTLHEGDPSIPKDLYQVEVPFLDQSVCDNEYGATNINNKCMFCAGKTGKDSCQGDSGGPLVFQHPEDKKYYEYGIVSWGQGCAEAGHAGVYSRVTAYCGFIQKTTGLDLCI